MCVCMRASVYVRARARAYMYVCVGGKGEGGRQRKILTSIHLCLSDDDRQHRCPPPLHAVTGHTHTQNTPHPPPTPPPTPRHLSTSGRCARGPAVDSAKRCAPVTVRHGGPGVASATRCVPVSVRPGDPGVASANRCSRCETQWSRCCFSQTVCTSHCEDTVVQLLPQPNAPFTVRHGGPGVNARPFTVRHGGPGVASAKRTIHCETRWSRCCLIQTVQPLGE